MTTTIQQIRDIMKCNKEVLGIETTKEMIMSGYYKFPTNKAKTIERTFYEVQEELRIANETENRIKDEFYYVSIMIALTFLVIGVTIGKFML